MRENSFINHERCIHGRSLNLDCFECRKTFGSENARQLEPASAGWRGFDVERIRAAEQENLKVTEWLRDRYPNKGRVHVREEVEAQSEAEVRVQGTPAWMRDRPADVEARDFTIEGFIYPDGDPRNYSPEAWIDILKTATVETQSPDAGCTVTVPSVVGLTVSEAAAAMRAVGLNPDVQSKWERKYHDAMRGYNHLIEQYRKRGERLKKEGDRRRQAEGDLELSDGVAMANARTAHKIATEKWEAVEALRATREALKMLEKAYIKLRDERLKTD